MALGRPGHRVNMTHEKELSEHTQVIPFNDDVRRQLEEAERFNREHATSEADRAPRPGDTSPDELPQRPPSHN